MVENMTIPLTSFFLYLKKVQKFGFITKIMDLLFLRENLEWRDNGEKSLICHSQCDINRTNSEGVHKSIDRRHCWHKDMVSKPL